MGLSIDEKYELLKTHKICFKCLNRQKKSECIVIKFSKCSRSNHHELLCKHETNQSDVNKSTQDASINNHSAKTDTSVSNSADDSTKCSSLFLLVEAYVTGSLKSAQLMFDGGADCSYITHDSARRLKTKSLGQVTLNVVSMGRTHSKYTTSKYEIPLVLKSKGSVTCGCLRNGDNN